MKIFTAMDTLYAMMHTYNQLGFLTKLMLDTFFFLYTNYCQFPIENTMAQHVRFDLDEFLARLQRCFDLNVTVLDIMKTKLTMKFIREKHDSEGPRLSKTEQFHIDGYSSSSSGVQSDPDSGVDECVGLHDELFSMDNNRLNRLLDLEEKAVALNLISIDLRMYIAKMTYERDKIFTANSILFCFSIL